ncbi:MAG: dienelactone hydrolase family protein [Hyphomicrobiaceae bacterium]
MFHHLDGPRIEPAGAPTALVVLLHGYGANGDDLIALGEGWQRSLPQAAFVAPNAPEEIPGMPGALQWFPLTFRDPRERWHGVVAARPALDRFLDAELARYRLAADRLVLAGFSQGTMLALHVGLRRTVAPAAVVGYSGLLAGPEYLDETGAEITARPPVLLIHGAEDDLIPVDALHLAREQLAATGVTVEWHVREGLGHGIDPDGQWLAGHFMAQTLSRQAR